MHYHNDNPQLIFFLIYLKENLFNLPFVKLNK